MNVTFQTNFITSTLFAIKFDKYLVYVALIISHYISVFQQKLNLKDDKNNKSVLFNFSVLFLVVNIFIEI